jgi:hypothetical protein
MINNDFKKQLTTFDITCKTLYSQYSKNASLFDFYQYHYLNKNLYPPTPIFFHIYNILKEKTDILMDIQTKQFDNWFILSSLHIKEQNYQNIETLNFISLSNNSTLNDFITYIIGYSKKINKNECIEKWVEKVKYQLGRDLIGMVNHQIIFINNLCLNSDNIKTQLNLDILDSSFTFLQLADIYFVYIMSVLEQLNIIFDYNQIIIILLLFSQYTKIYITDLVLMNAYNKGFVDLLNIDSLQLITCNLLMYENNISISFTCNFQFPSFYNVEVPIYFCKFNMVIDILQYSINIYNYKCKYPIKTLIIPKLTSNISLIGTKSHKYINKTRKVKPKKLILVEKSKPFYHHPYL